jgi:hypothetical protein
MMWRRPAEEQVPNVCFWHLADMTRALSDVRLPLKRTSIEHARVRFLTLSRQLRLPV